MIVVNPAADPSRRLGQAVALASARHRVAGAHRPLRVDQHRNRSSGVPVIGFLSNSGSERPESSCRRLSCPHIACAPSAKVFPSNQDPQYANWCPANILHTIVREMALPSPRPML